jgi:hypothetical protein
VTDLCTTADVEALLGYPIPAAQTDRVTALIGMASGVVGDAIALPSGDVPRSVAYVTASLVVRTMSNPGQLTSEAIGTYHAGYPGSGMALTDADRDVLRPWLVAEHGAYTVCLPLGQPCGLDDGFCPPFDWERDLDAEAVDR